MKKHILFIQGGGSEGYEADAYLVASLQKALGKEYDIHYPELKSDEAIADFGWPLQIGTYISESKKDLILIAHSLGASLLLKYLSENSVNKKIDGIFLIATPFWNGNEDWQAGLKLKQHFSSTLPQKVPIFFYHCEDDEVVPFSQLAEYKEKCTQAIFREIKNGGHQLNNDLSLVAKDIKAL